MESNCYEVLKEIRETGKLEKEEETLKNALTKLLEEFGVQ